MESFDSAWTHLSPIASGFVKLMAIFPEHYRYRGWVKEIFEMGHLDVANVDQLFEDMLNELSHAGIIGYANKQQGGSSLITMSDAVTEAINAQSDEIDIDSNRVVVIDFLFDKKQEVEKLNEYPMGVEPFEYGFAALSCVGYKPPKALLWGQSISQEYLNKMWPETVRRLVVCCKWLVEEHLVQQFLPGMFHVYFQAIELSEYSFQTWGYEETKPALRQIYVHIGGFFKDFEAYAFLEFQERFYYMIRLWSEAQPMDKELLHKRGICGIQLLDTYKTLCPSAVSMVEHEKEVRALMAKKNIEMNITRTVTNYINN